MHLPVYVKPASIQEKQFIDTWLEARGRADLWEDYPLGWAVYDKPLTASEDEDEAARRFVRLDHYLRRLLPHLAGLYAQELEDYYATVFGHSRFNFLGDLKGPYLDGEAVRDPHNPLPAPDEL